MKRIMNNVAVATILFTVCPDTEILIIDIDHYLAAWMKEPVERISEDHIQRLTVDEILHDYNNIKICNAKVYRTAVKDNMIMLVVDTKNEQY